MGVWFGEVFSYCCFFLAAIAYAYAHASYLHTYLNARTTAKAEDFVVIVVAAARQQRASASSQ